MISIGIGTGLLLLGIMFIVIKGLSVEYIDAEGILHENFFLLPIGFLCIFCGLITYITVGLRGIVFKMKHK